jgi:hypothetical protein
MILPQRWSGKRKSSRNVPLRVCLGMAEPACPQHDRLELDLTLSQPHKMD